MGYQHHRPTYAEINLANFIDNIAIAKQLSHSDIIAVVKADAYGHGAKELSLYAYEHAGIDAFAVATMTEALNLRESFKDHKVDIYILGYITEKYISEAINADLILPIFDYDYAKVVSDIAISMNSTARVVLEIDTGMNRLGFKPDILLKKFLSTYSNLNIVHIFSHLATYEPIFVAKQTDLFDRLLERNSDYQFTTSFLNSSGIVSHENRWNLTRPGIMLYGYNSTGSIKNLKPVMSIISTITHIKHLKQGDAVGYNRTFIASKDMTIGVVPLGYADGYPLSLSNNAYMLIDDIKCNVVGTICMDMTMIDISSVDGDLIGRKVIVMNDKISASMLAEWSNSISYEILTGISYRIPRVYIK